MRTIPGATTFTRGQRLPQGRHRGEGGSENAVDAVRPQELEKHFGVRVDIERLELDQLRSLAAIATFVAARLRRRAEGAAAD